MTNTQIVKELVNLEPHLNIYEIEEVKRDDKIVKIISIENSKTRVRCPNCKMYTRSVHDKLKPIEVKYLKIVGYTTYLKVYKRRFHCHNCNKIFTENDYINGTKKKISLKTEQKILLQFFRRYAKRDCQNIRKALLFWK